MSEKRWPIPEGYYEQIAESEVNALMHASISKLVIGATALRHGQQLVYAPQSALDLDSNAMCIANHRSKKDIGLFVDATERIGLHHVRPYAKDPLFASWLMNRIYHGLGAFAVDRDKPDIRGISHAAHRMLMRGQSLMNFSEEERIYKDIRNVAEFKPGGVHAAVTARVPILCFGIAGVGIEKDDLEKKILHKDKSAPLGLGQRQVAVFAEPIFTTDFIDGPPPEQKGGRAELRATRELLPNVRNAVQQCLDTAYAIREGATPDGSLVQV